MTVGEKIIPFVRNLVGGLSSAEITDEQIIKFLNEAWNEFQIKLSMEREDFFVMGKKINSLIAGENAYTFPKDMLILKRMEINYEDPTREDLYRKATEVDVSNLGTNMSWEWLVKNQPITQPLYDHRGDYFEIAPMPQKNVINGIKIYYLAKRKILDANNEEKDEFTSVSDQIPYPLNLYPEAICYKIASDYLRSIGSTSYQIMEANNLLTLYQEKVKTIINGIQPREQMVYNTQGLNLTGYEF